MAPWRMASDAETLFYLQDANWNVQTLCNKTGAVVERCLYDPYGTPTFCDLAWGNESDQSAVSNRVLFQGRLWSPSTFTYEYRHREYSPYLGRFMQRDPIGVWGDAGNWGDQLHHLVLPSLAIGLSWVGYIARLVRASPRSTHQRPWEPCLWKARNCASSTAVPMSSSPG